MRDTRDTTRPDRETAQPERETAEARLMRDEDEQEFRRRWASVQTSFVDEPRRAVQQADELVAEVTKRVTDMFSSQRSRLEEYWGREQEVSTEDLRLVLQRYRSFFDRLLGMRSVTDKG